MTTKVAPKLVPRTREHLLSLIKNARPINEKDWASERQIDAENLVWDQFDHYDIMEEFDQLQEESGGHATTDELLDDAVGVVYRNS